MNRSVVKSDSDAGVQKLHLAAGQTVWDILAQTKAADDTTSLVRSGNPPAVGHMVIFMKACGNVAEPFPAMPQDVERVLFAYASGDHPRSFTRSRAVGCQGGADQSSVLPFAEAWLATNDMLVGTAPTFIKGAFITLWEATAAALTASRSADDVTLACAQFHNAFIVMTPFIVMNGRFARGVINWVLILFGMQPLMCSARYNVAMRQDAEEVIYRDPHPPNAATEQMVELITLSQSSMVCWVCGVDHGRRFCPTCLQFVVCGACDISPHAEGCSPFMRLL